MLLGLLTWALVASVCGIAVAAGTGPGVLRLVTTTTVFADMVRQVGGERVEVTSIVPPGGDPHTYDPTPQEARAVATADLLFVNGLGLEMWANRLIDASARPDLVRVTLSDGLDPLTGSTFTIDVRDHDRDHDHDHDHDHGGGDPHFWLDVRHAMHYVERIHDALVSYDPAGEAIYAARAETYLSALGELDAWIESQIAQIPPDRRKLVTYHDAFGYFAHRYGLELVGFLVRNPDREPSPREMAALAGEIDALNVPAVFGEAQINPRFAEALAREAGVSVAILHSDALTDAVPTYVEMMRANARAVVEALR